MIAAAHLSSPLFYTFFLRKREDIKSDLGNAKLGLLGWG